MNKQETITAVATVLASVLAVGGFMWGMDSVFARKATLETEYLKEHFIDDGFTTVEEHLQLAGSLRDYRYQQRVFQLQDRISQIQATTGKIDCGKFKEVCKGLKRDIETTEKEVGKPIKRTKGWK